MLHDFSGLWRIWTDATALQQYYPLTGTSFWLHYQLRHWWTPPYHAENVLLHASCALLLWRLLRKLEVPGAWLTGALFALHPVMAESAAWITERKNVLSMLLFLAALLTCGGCPLGFVFAATCASLASTQRLCVSTARPHARSRTEEQRQPAGQAEQGSDRRSPQDQLGVQDFARYEVG